MIEDQKQIETEAAPVDLTASLAVAKAAIVLFVAAAAKRALDAGASPEEQHQARMLVLDFASDAQDLAEACLEIHAKLLEVHGVAAVAAVN